MPDEDRRELERLRTALKASGDIVYEWDLTSGHIIWSSNAALALGLEDVAELATADAFRTRINAEDLAARTAILATHLRGEGTYDAEFRVRSGTGDFCWVQDRGMAEFDEQGQATRMVGTMRVVTERKEREAQLEFLASYDELTGHLNRSRLRDALAHALAYSLRYNAPSAFLLVGIDNLTVINDAYGYDVADAAIVSVGQRLETCLRNTDVIGRVAGNRFGIVLANCAEADMARIADKILKAVRGTVIETGPGPVSLSVSIGGVAIPTAARTTYAAMQHAEEALSTAKAGGRDCFHAYLTSESREVVRRRNVAIAERVVTALKERRLALAFQPIVDATDHSIIRQHECLIRMIEPDGQVTAAGLFIPVVEQLGLVRLVDRRALELGLDVLQRHREARLALNVSGLTASDQGWLRSVLATIRAQREVADRLTIEITETVAIQDIEEMARFVATLRELGCKVALDDFGAGYTSFRHLKSLAVDKVKIDGAFVRDLANSPENQLFVRTLLDLAAAFNLETVAECVETQEDAETLRQLGVQQLQGYLFGKPSFEPFGLQARPMGTGAE
ncbi:putative bifunctional diguanylate cyclase/phosphodiesterase [Zavarzinia sp. CC-PAN008]|uniref:putative bifunctional diguanylate cyclase/phosphodiesterase n=1 Tax=Zavarzinia sp. CC-PAN008 TaxID=3243332 RepID=UPI003F749AF4